MTSNSSRAGRILMIIPGLPLGGAEIVFARIARAIAQQRQVVVMVLNPWGLHPDVRAILGDVPVHFPPLSSGLAYSVLRRLSVWTQGRWACLNPLDFLATWSLRRLYQRYQFDVINAHLLAAERAAALAFPGGQPAIIATDHGDYRWVLNEGNRHHYQPALEQVAAMICLSDKNIALARAHREFVNIPYYKVYNGFCAEGDESSVAPVDQPRGERPYVFGMVSRGIAEKGWAEAVAAFTALKRKLSLPMELLLVGGGEEMDRLQREVSAAGIEGIQFAGYQRNTLPFVRQFDAALLPTYYQAESLPTVIVECLSAGVPVIATDVGGIREMLETPEGLAGAVVRLNANGKADVDELVLQMEKLASNPSSRAAAKTNAKKAFEKFDMATCVNHYLEIFDRHSGLVQDDLAAKAGSHRT